MHDNDALLNTVPRETQDLFKDIVSRETFQKFEDYRLLLEKWQKGVNLVSKDSLKEFWNRHLVDSLQLIRYIPENRKILDVGSGGGFPGAVLAITNKYDVTCLDSDFKKCSFLRALFGELKIKAKVTTDRIENLSPESNHFDIITARGFADVKTLINIVSKFGTNTIGVFLKGRNVVKEIDDAKASFSFQYDLYKSITSSDGFVLVVKECRKK